jgi:hypothetical protein
MDDVMSVVLDLVNIVGGLLLAVALLALVPRLGGGIRRGLGVLVPFGWVVGVIALVAGGYFLIKHIVDGPHVFHFEVVGIAVGVCLLWDRLRDRTAVGSSGDAVAGGGATVSGGTAVQTEAGVVAETGVLTGTALLLAVFGLIAFVVGLEGLFTAN